MPGVARGAAAVLREERHVGVVVHDHGQAEALAHQVAEANAGERQMVRPSGDAGLPFDQRGDTEADRLHVRGGGAHLVYGADEDLERLLAIGPAPQPVHAMMHHQILVYDASQKLRSPGVDTDHAPRWHGR